MTPTPLPIDDVFSIVSDRRRRRRTAAVRTAAVGLTGAGIAGALALRSPSGSSTIPATTPAVSATEPFTTITSSTTLPALPDSPLDLPSVKTLVATSGEPFSPRVIEEVAAAWRLPVDHTQALLLMCQLHDLSVLACSGLAPDDPVELASTTPLAASDALALATAWDLDATPIAVKAVYGALGADAASATAEQIAGYRDEGYTALGSSLAGAWGDEARIELKVVVGIRLANGVRPPSLFQLASRVTVQNPTLVDEATARWNLPRSAAGMFVAFGEQHGDL